MNEWMNEWRKKGKTPCVGSLVNPWTQSTQGVTADSPCQHKPQRPTFCIIYHILATGIHGSLSTTQWPHTDKPTHIQRHRHTDKHTHTDTQKSSHTEIQRHTSCVKQTDRHAWPPSNHLTEKTRCQRTRTHTAKGTTITTPPHPKVK